MIRKNNVANDPFASSADKLVLDEKRRIKEEKRAEKAERHARD